MTLSEFRKEVSYASDIDEPTVRKVIESIRTVIIRGLRDGEKMYFCEGIYFVPRLVKNQRIQIPGQPEEYRVPEHWSYKAYLTRQFKDKIRDENYIV